MTNECITPDAVVNPLRDIDFDVSDPNGWYRYVADSFVLTGLSRRSGEAFAREVRILVRRFEMAPFMPGEGNVRASILRTPQEAQGQFPAHPNLKSAILRPKMGF